MFYKWGVVISYQFLHLTIIQGYSKLSLLDKGFPKGGGGGGGPTFGKNSQIMSFFFFLKRTLSINVCMNQKLFSLGKLVLGIPFLVSVNQFYV